MTESKLIEDLKKHWRKAMIDWRKAQERVNHYSTLILEERKKEMMDSLDEGDRE